MTGKVFKLMLVVMTAAGMSACKQKAGVLHQSDYPAPPVAEKIYHSFTESGGERIDNYYWIRDPQDPKAIEYLTAENEYTATVMRHTEPLQEKLYNELVGMVPESDESYPTFRRGYFSYSRTEEGKQYRIYCRRKGSMDAPEEVIFDVNKMAEGKNTYMFRGYSISLDNNLAVYSYNETGSFAESTLKVKDLSTGNDLPDVIEKVSSFTWANDNKTIFYSTVDSALRPYRIYAHVLGGKGPDRLVYEEKDPRYNIGLISEKTRQYVMIISMSSTTSEVRYIDANRPTDQFKVFLPRKQGIQYSLEPHTDGFFVYYKDENESPNGMIYRAPKEGFADMEKWTVFWPHDPDIMLYNFDILKDYIAVISAREGLDRITITDLNTGGMSEISFPEPVYTLSMSGNPEFDATTIRYTYSSLNRPSTLYDYDIPTETSRKLKEQVIPSGFNPDDYVVERLWADAPDGVKVPMALVYKKGLKKNGKNPVLLESYGSYGSSSDAYFYTYAYSLINRGFVYAIAQVRGGSELGEHWYQDGKLLNKKNTFTDFIACTEKLIKDGYTSPDKMAITGASAGGLLMGAVVNMRPDLFNTVLAGVPFVDLMTTMFDTSLPLTTQEYEEWGNPNEEEYYNYMLSYSPYDNVEAKDYPNMLVTTGLNDSQVGFHEPAKWVAKLRDMKTDDNIILLKTNMDSGHGGATGRYDYLRQVAFEWAFLLDRMGINE